MKALIASLARLIGIRRPARTLPAWFDSAYLSGPALPALPQILPQRDFDERERAAIWRKGRAIIGWDADDWRVDHLGNPIFRHHYADPDSAFGWTIALVAAEGGDDLANLRPQLCHQPGR